MQRLAALAIATFIIAIAFTASNATAEGKKGKDVKSREYCQKLATQRGFSARKGGRGKFVRACRQGRSS